MRGRTIFHYPSQHPVDRDRRAAAATLPDRLSVYGRVNGLSCPAGPVPGSPWFRSRSTYNFSADWAELFDGLGGFPQS